MAKRLLFIVIKGLFKALLVTTDKHLIKIYTYNVHLLKLVS